MAKYSNHKTYDKGEGPVAVAVHADGERFSLKLSVEGAPKPIWHCLTLSRAEAIAIAREIEYLVTSTAK